MSRRRTHIQLTRESIRNVWKHIEAGTLAGEHAAQLKTNLLYYSDAIIRGVYDEDNIASARDRYDVEYTSENYTLHNEHHHNPMSHFFSPETRATRNFFGLMVSTPYYAAQLWSDMVIDYRFGLKDDAFYILGRILHLLQDMGVPAHTHIIAHPFGDPYEQYAGNNARTLDYVFESPHQAPPLIITSLYSVFLSLAAISYEQDEFSTDNTKLYTELSVLIPTVIRYGTGLLIFAQKQLMEENI